jgi:hypothetical protein
MLFYVKEPRGYRDNNDKSTSDTMGPGVRPSEEKAESGISRFSVSQQLLLLLGSFYGTFPITDVFGKSPKPAFRWCSLVTMWTTLSAFVLQLYLFYKRNISNKWQCLLINQGATNNTAGNNYNQSANTGESWLYITVLLSSHIVDHKAAEKSRFLSMQPQLSYFACIH